jgi:hypothetical protein
MSGLRLSDLAIGAHEDRGIGNPERHSAARPNAFHGYHAPQETRSSGVVLFSGDSESLGEDYAAKVALEGRELHGFQLIRLRPKEAVRDYVDCTPTLC